MADYEHDDSEFLIQHFSLEKVLSFVAARDEVRRIACAQVERPEEASEVVQPVSSIRTMPAAQCRVIEAA